MKHLRYISLTLVTLIWLISFTTVTAVTLNGALKSETGETISLINVKVNDSVNKLSESGIFSIKTSKSRHYQLLITSEGYYSSYHTFSHHELQNMSDTESNDSLTLPDIYLVKRKPERVMFAFTGDAMMARRYSKPYFNDPVLIRDNHKDSDTKNIIQHMKPYLELADYASVNLETQIAEKKPSERAPKSVTFFSPPETLAALKWAGVDYVTLGNNHLNDYLDEGMISTLKYLNQSGLGYSGAGMEQQQALTPQMARLGGKDFAMLGFVGWKGGFSPHQAAGPDKGGAALGSAENIYQSVTKLSQKGHPTVVQYHGSLEYSEEPSRMTQSKLKMAIDAGADLVIAHHPHVTQGFELYKGKLIAWSMGNFIFDQYYHQTPLSYVVYVWMDGEVFHRAEVVPIYLKGYVPIPATGIQRNSLTKRTTTLSDKRDVRMTTSGGHLVINPESGTSVTRPQTLVFAADETIKELYHFPVSGTIDKIESKQGDIPYRLGENMLNGGDFESYDSFTSNERGWLLESAKVKSAQSYSGDYSVAVTIKGKKARVGMQTFSRVFNFANPMTYQAKIFNTEKPVKARLYLQFRGTKDKFFAALAKGKKQLLNETIIPADNNWQNYQVNFITPRVGYKSYRIFLELSPIKEGRRSQRLYLDDISLIQWQAHYNSKNSFAATESMKGLATHIDLMRESNRARQLDLYFRN